MINKNGIWFLTLFSLILVLSIYYITMPSEVLKEDVNNDVSIVVESSDELLALRVDADNELEKEMKELQTILSDVNITADEKNEAFEKLKNLNIVRGEEEQLEKMIKNEHDLSSFVKVRGNDINVVVKADGNSTLANKIMRTIQSNYSNKMYITIKFR